MNTNIKTNIRKQMFSKALFSVFGFLAFTATAFAGVGGSVVPDYPATVIVGQATSTTLTITNTSTAANAGENVSVTSITHTPSCGSSANSTCTGADIDLGVFTAHNGTGRVGTACAGVTFTASAPDASGKITFTPSSAITLGPASGPVSGAQCIIDFSVDVLKVPTKDAAIVAGVQTSPLGGALFQGQTSLINGSGFGSTETTVSKVSPSIATLLSAEVVAIGTAVHDSATITGSTADAGGTVTYNVYAGASCSGTPVFTDTKNVTNHLVPDSGNFIPLSAGIYNWQAVYSGDANNNASTSPCQTETMTVGKASPIISTVLSTTSASVGASVNDTATLSGATATAGGTVSYTAFINNSCSAGAMNAGTKTVTNGIVPNSDALVFNSVGTFYWQAVYSGDVNNNAATSTCTEEIVTITQPKGHIIIVKDAQPNDAQDFTFTNNFGNGNLASFMLDDDADATLSNTKDSEVNAGTYAVSEGVVSGWTQTSATCSDGSPIGAVVVSPGETVTCTFVNTKVVVAGQYCSPGYWKQPQHFDSYVTYKPTDLFNTVFGENTFPGMTLVQVLSQGGGDINALGRATVGALLNSTSMNSKFTSAQVISMFQNAYPGTKSAYNALKAQFEVAENCPLN